MGRGQALAAALLLSACAPASGGTVPNGDLRIVSLNPCADAILAEVAPDALVAISHYSHDPAGSSMDMEVARRFASTSGSAEEVAALSPDLVVAGTFLPPATEIALERMGLRVVQIGSIRSVDDARSQVRELAVLAGRQEAGEAMVARIDASLTAAAPPPGQEPLSALVWQAGGIVPGNETLVADLLAQTGFANFSTARGLGQGALVPLEDVLADPPPIVLNAGQSRMQLHPALAALGTEVVPFDTRLTWCGGPTIPRAAARLAEIRQLAQIRREAR